MKILYNGTVITLDPANPVIHRGAVAVKGDRIAELGTEELLDKYPQARRIDAQGGLIMPGLLNTHMHAYSAFARGMAIPDYNPRVFTDILKGLWWRLDKLLTPRDNYYSALVSGIEAIKNGTTTLIDHHASPYSAAGSLDELARAFSQLGLRASLSYEVSDRDGPEIARAGIEENRRFARWCQQERPPRLAASFGLHASFTLSDDTLKACAEAAGDIGFHVHTAEGIEDREYNLQHYGLPVVKRLDKYGIWNPRSLAIHCVHIDDEEMELLGQRDVSVIHNPESNMGNAVGRADIAAMWNHGLRVGLGSDGYTTDMFEGMKVANLIHKHGEGDPRAGSQVPAMAFDNNIDIVCRHFGVQTGRLLPDWQADVIIVQYKPYTPLTADNWWSHLLMGVSGGMVRTVLVDGNILMEDRQLLTVDEEEVYAHARKQAESVWKRL
ncbi:MAG: putative aminohydrolase SsnA [Bacillota bacterium]|jgi:putative selenium metabolism protein SsnA|nr:putative aminohydrolase SsnA [Bacillota bacterium]HOC06970.1 putative aminohydrolase SsnA [Bacillota bacterium]HPZ22602.1 putative aminohydrolase SsnA [Bacillota bacterium]HQD20359.1 putative aminohydrolase SsnA [Bacillota bacterium]